MSSPVISFQKKRLFQSCIAALLLLGGGGDAISQNDRGSILRLKQANKGYFAEQDRPASWHYDQQRKVVRAIDALKAEREGVIDTYIVVAAIDGDPVFGREAAESAKVLESRYNAQGRTITIAAGNGAGDMAAASGSPANLWSVLGGVAAKMNVKEDVLILYTTSHGSPGVGIVYKDGDKGFGMISPWHMGEKLSELGFERRLIIISACYSGEFIPPLFSEQSIIITASSPIKSSFGCDPTNDWTFFGDAFINQAMRKGLSLKTAADSAFAKISEWEMSYDLRPSEPQYFAGSDAAGWLSVIEARIPRNSGKPVGTPAIAALKELKKKPQKARK